MSSSPPISGVHDVSRVQGRKNYAKIIVSLEKQVRADLIAKRYGTKLLEIEATCAEAAAGEPLPGSFSGLPLDAGACVLFWALL